jgi:hypothetical protein
MNRKKIGGRRKVNKHPYSGHAKIVRPDTTDFSMIEDSKESVLIISELARKAGGNAAAAARELDKLVVYVRDNEVVCMQDGKVKVLSKSVKPVKKYAVGTVLHAKK